MKILEIKSLITDEKFTNYLLSNKIMDDKVLEQSFFVLKIENSPATFVDIIYRRYWETMYVKNHYKSAIYEDYCLLIMTLSEALQFIYSAAPPVLKNVAEKEFTNCESIKNNLYMLLSEENSEHIYYTNILKDTLHMKVFNTEWKYGNKSSLIKSNEDYELYNIARHDKTALFVYKCKNPLGMLVLFEDFVNKDYEITNVTIKGKDILVSLFTHNF